MDNELGKAWADLVDAEGIDNMRSKDLGNYLAKVVEKHGDMTKGEWRVKVLGFGDENSKLDGSMLSEIIALCEQLEEKYPGVPYFEAREKEKSN